jgi:hypothetical protein
MGTLIHKKPVRMVILLVALIAPNLVAADDVTWNVAPYGYWASDCHYPGQSDLGSVKLTANFHDCGATCQNTQSCTHFVKTADGPYGTCYMKSGPIPAPTVATQKNYYLCGTVTNPKQPAGTCNQPNGQYVTVQMADSSVRLWRWDNAANSIDPVDLYTIASEFADRVRQICPTNPNGQDVNCGIGNQVGWRDMNIALLVIP